MSQVDIELDIIEGAKRISADAHNDILIAYHYGSKSRFYGKAKEWNLLDKDGYDRAMRYYGHRWHWSGD